MAEDESSDLSSLSSLSPAPSEDESDISLKKEKGILKFFHKLPAGTRPTEPKREESPPTRKRSPSPLHEYVLADNPDIAVCICLSFASRTRNFAWSRKVIVADSVQFIVMFRSRFTEIFPKSLPNFGPQELERDVIDTVPGDRVEQFLCAVLGLLLNRKQDVRYDAIISATLEYPETDTMVMQTWPLWSRIRRCYCESQEPMAEILGGEEPSLWRCFFQFNEPIPKGTCRAVAGLSVYTSV